MIQIREYLTTKINKSIIKATDDTIRQIVKEEMNKYGHDCDLNHVDVSKVTNMNYLFSCHTWNDLDKMYDDLNPDVSEWNVSNVEQVKLMFNGCKRFNCSINEWNVSNVKNIRAMFNDCSSFNQDLNEWDVSNVTDMGYMFYKCTNFNQPLHKWDVSNVQDMSEMFYECTSFNQDISKWNVSNVIEMECMFIRCPIQKNYKPKFK